MSGRDMSWAVLQFPQVSQNRMQIGVEELETFSDQNLYLWCKC